MLKNFLIRPFKWDDLEVLSDLISAINEVPYIKSKSQMEDFKRSLSGPWQKPERDIFIAECESSAIGYVSLELESDTGRAIANGGVHPNFRRQKIGSALLKYATSHSSKLGLSLFQLDLPDSSTNAIGFCKSNGFEHVRTHIHLSLGKSVNLSYSLDHKYNIRGMLESDIESITSVQNLAFSGTWGFQENTVEDIRYRIKERHIPPADHLDIIETLDGELLGYCWSLLKQSGEVGTIGMVGIRPKAQGEGLGRAITSTGVKWLIENQANPIHITVDAENYPAVNLYKSIGFEPEWESFWYQKII